MTSSFEELLHDLKHGDYHVRYKAARYLGNLGDERAIPYLIQMLGELDSHDEESKVNMWAASSLAHFKEAAFQPLCEALQPDPNHHKDGWRRYWVLQTLGILGDQRAVDVLIQMLETTDNTEIVEGSAFALSRLNNIKAIEPIRRTLARLTTQNIPNGYWYTALNNTLQTLTGK